MEKAFCVTRIERSLDKLRPSKSLVSSWVGTPLIEKMPDLAKKVDNNGKTPLHYAAELGDHLLLKDLLRVDKSAAFMYDNEGYTPLLRAAANGYHLCIKFILELCPHSLELRHASNKRTVLHFAKPETLKCIKHYQGVAKLINVRDNEGNTPLHCAVLEADDEKTLQLLSAEGVNLWIRNKKDQSPMGVCEDLMSDHGSKQLAIIWFIFEDARERLEGTHKVPMISWIKALYMMNKLVMLNETNMKNLLDNISVAAALLVALTFAATFAIPGGYDQYTGQALRMKEPAIQVFVVSDVVAMLLGIGILLKYTYAVIRHKSLGKLPIDCIVLLLCALLATIIAFTSGVYAIVHHDAKWIGILVIVGSVLANFFLYTV